MLWAVFGGGVVSQALEVFRQRLVRSRGLGTGRGVGVNDLIPPLIWSF